MPASTTVPKSATKKPKDTNLKVRQPKRPYKRVEENKLAKHVECFTRQVTQHTLKVDVVKARLDSLTEKLNVYSLKLQKYVAEQTYRATEQVAADQAGGSAD